MARSVRPVTQAAADEYGIPPWTVGWRMARSLDWAGISVQQMADELAVSRSTVSGWLNDRHAPRVIYLRAWAARCRVPYGWLVHGDEAVLPRVDSNHQPAGWFLDLDSVQLQPHDPVTVCGDRALADREILALQHQFRGQIRRGTARLTGSRQPLATHGDRHHAR